MNNYLLEVELGFICNYTCEYCSFVNRASGSWIAYDPLVKFIDTIDPDRVVLVGGEPTYYPNISSLLKELQNRTVYVTTNGSRSLSWWKEFYKYIDVLTLSYHINDTPFESFYEKVEFLSENMTISINIPTPPLQFNECLKIADSFTKLDNVFVGMKPLIDNETGKHFIYPDGVLESMSVLRTPPRHTKKDNSKRKNKRAYTNIVDKTNRYRGWRCWKGIDLLKVIPNGDIFKACCEPGREDPIGNINGTYTIPTSPSICNLDECVCITDLNQIRKEENI